MLFLSCGEWRDSGNTLRPAFSERKQLEAAWSPSRDDLRPRLSLAYALYQRFRAFRPRKFQALRQACNSRILTAKLPPAVIGRISVTGAFLPCSYSIVPSVPRKRLFLSTTRPIPLAHPRQNCLVLQSRLPRGPPAFFASSHVLPSFYHQTDVAGCAAPPRFALVTRRHNDSFSGDLQTYGSFSKLMKQLVLHFRPVARLILPLTHTL